MGHTIQDVGATPKQGSIYQNSLPPPSSSSQLPSESSETQFDVSGRSSPTKKLAKMALDVNEPLETRPLTRPDSIPDGPLLGLFEKMEYLGCAEGLLPAKMESEFQDAARSGKIARIGRATFNSSGERDRLGPTPAIDDVLAIVREASQCQELQHTEHSWNCAVHFPLLRLAIHGGYARKNQLVDFDSCTHARPNKAYRHTSTWYPATMVDFAIVLRPRCVEDNRRSIVHAIDQLRRQLPGESINHTDHYPFLFDPIAVSVETKRPDNGEQKQALQTGSSQAAQWRFLYHLVEKRFLDTDPGREPGPELEERCHEVLDKLGYLPAIFVRGHHWFFAATTRQGRSTTLWREVDLGTTRTALGVYSIIYAIQLLAQDTRDHFWPWFLDNVLGIPSV
ncbi:hypothetical protein LZ31DRAFT_536602 [Colletotrichum somersetense]|nr:hypothetical protein LZ31DRAFT_536602 [Colletotrichum somersetense]